MTEKVQPKTRAEVAKLASTKKGRLEILKELDKTLEYFKG